MSAKQRGVLTSFEAQFRGLNSGSPVVDSITDFLEYLAFLEHPSWSAPQDLNEIGETDERKSRYSRFKSRMSSYKRKPIPATDDADWHSDCEPVDGLSADPVQAEIQGGWRCSHFPVGLDYNGNRPRSLERKSKKKSRKNSVAQEVIALFDDNPYDSFHRDNINKLRCCTNKAFNYDIEPHLAKARLEEDITIVTRRVQIMSR